MSDVPNITVIGAGLMGHGIALTFGRIGCAVSVSDPDAEMRATLHGRVRQSMELLGAGPEEIETTCEAISLREEIAPAVKDADFVFEAAPEKLALKQSIFAEIEAHTRPNTVLASNTLSLIHI